jgi:hypothetical protein
MRLTSRHIPVQAVEDARFGSWLCENALAEALTNRDFGELTVFGHLAVFGGLFCLESS